MKDWSESIFLLRRDGEQFAFTTNGFRILLRVMLNRAFLVCLVLLAAAWLASYIIDVHERSEDEAFYKTKVAPYLNSPDPAKLLGERGIMDQWLDRGKLRGFHGMLRQDLLFVGTGLTFVWALIGTARHEAYWRKRNARGRAADPNAGIAIANLRQQSALLVARTQPRAFPLLPQAQREIAIDFANRDVTFRRFKFTTSFVGNKSIAEIRLPFSEILGGRIWANNGRFSLALRTTAGQVTITDAVQPFQPVTAALLDAAEVNRKDPARFAAALALEPRIKTPWYGWLIFAFALGAVAALSFFLWNMPVTQSR